MVTRPAEGIPAAPMAAAVAVILGKKRLITEVNDGQLIWERAGRGLNFPCIFFRDFRLCSMHPMQTKRLPPFWLRKIR